MLAGAAAHLHTTCKPLETLTETLGLVPRSGSHMVAHVYTSFQSLIGFGKTLSGFASGRDCEAALSQGSALQTTMIRNASKCALENQDLCISSGGSKRISLEVLMDVSLLNARGCVDS